ncbi:Pkinase-domain-containing protein, partial [Aureobasidium melanogenum]
LLAFQQQVLAVASLSRGSVGIVVCGASPLQRSPSLPASAQVEEERWQEMAPAARGWWIWPSLRLPAARLHHVSWLEDGFYLLLVPPQPSRKWQCSTPKAVGWSSKSVATCCGLSSFVEIEHAALFVLRICEAGLSSDCMILVSCCSIYSAVPKSKPSIFLRTRGSSGNCSGLRGGRMYHDFRKTSALRRISDQHASDQILALCTQPRRILYCSLLDLGMQLRHTLIVERDLAADEDIQDNTKTPDINFGTGVSFRLQKLGCSEVEGTTERLQEALRREGVAQTEVDDFDVATCTSGSWYGRHRAYRRYKDGRPGSFSVLGIAMFVG